MACATTGLVGLVGKVPVYRAGGLGSISGWKIEEKAMLLV